MGGNRRGVKAHKAKTRQRRLIPISPQLRAWLDCAREVGGQLPSVNYADKLKLILEKAELREESTRQYQALPLGERLLIALSMVERKKKDERPSRP